MSRPAIAFILAALSAATASAATAAQGPDLEKAFAMADANHDGVVTRAEFEASRAARFHALDRNHDGYLSKEDMPAGLGLLRSTAPRMMQMLSMFDTDHDGRISLQEFVAGSMRLFEQADTNHDGVVTHAEVAAAAGRFKAFLNTQP